VVTAQARNRALALNCIASKNHAPEMHLPQIVADLKYRRQIVDKVFSANLRLPELLGGAFDQRISAGKR
jgi:hypothetical protein